MDNIAKVRVSILDIRRTMAKLIGCPLQLSRLYDVEVASTLDVAFDLMRHRNSCAAISNIRESAAFNPAARGAIVIQGGAGDVVLTEDGGNGLSNNPYASAFENVIGTTQPDKRTYDSGWILRREFGSDELLPIHCFTALDILALKKIAERVANKNWRNFWFSNWHPFKYAGREF